jgi:hypothetical protein
MKKQKTTQPMNSGTKFEGRASSSQGKHEGESSVQLCDRLCRTRESSQRQLPTDHDYAVSTREYQTDQSSPKPASAVASPVLEKRKKQRQRQKQPHRFAGIDRVTPYQLMSNCSWCSAGSLFTITVFLVSSSISSRARPLLALSALATSGFTRNITSVWSRCLAILRISM